MFDGQNIYFSTLILFVAVAVIAWWIMYYRNATTCNRIYKTADRTMKEKQFILPDGSIINYGEGPNNGDALLLLHEQTATWRDYSKVFDSLTKQWHVFAIDSYGHGGSSHDPSKYSMKANGDDIITFLKEVIQKPTVLSGHGTGGLQAAYIAAYGGDQVKGLLLEDPPVFSSEAKHLEHSFSYVDLYQPIHNYLENQYKRSWPSFYIQNSIYVKTYMHGTREILSYYAQSASRFSKGKPVALFLAPPAFNHRLIGFASYDLNYGDAFYHKTWQNVSQEALLQRITVPTVYLYSYGNRTEHGFFLGATEEVHAERALELLSDGELIKADANHNLHWFQPEHYLDGLHRLTKKMAA